MTAPDQTFLTHLTRGQGEFLAPLCHPVFLKKNYILIFSALYKKYKIPKLAKICSI